MKLRAYVTSFSLVLATTLVATPFIPEAQAFGVKPDDSWRVPPRIAKKRNPYPPGPHSQEIGMAIYQDECRQCHGQSGISTGDELLDLSHEQVMSQSDGELFWKIRHGRGDMPSFRRTLSKSETWHVINYLRSEVE